MDLPRSSLPRLHFLIPFRQDFSLSPDLRRQNLPILSMSQLQVFLEGSSVYPTIPSPPDLWCRHTKPKKEHTCFISLLLLGLADVTVFCWLLFRAHLVVGDKVGKWPFLLCLSLMCPKSTLFGAIMSFIWVQTPASMMDSHFYSSAVTEISHWVNFIMPDFLSLWGNTFRRTHSGPVLTGFEEATSPFLLPAYLNCSSRCACGFPPQRVHIYFHQSYLFYQLDTYTCSPAVGSANLCITNSS